MSVISLAPRDSQIAHTSGSQDDDYADTLVLLCGWRQLPKLGAIEIVRGDDGGYVLRAMRSLTTQAPGLAVLDALSAHTVGAQLELSPQSTPPAP